MLSGLVKIWKFAGEEKSNMNKSIILEFVYALFNMLEIAAIYLVLEALLGKSTDYSLAWKSLLLLLVSIGGRSLINYYAQLMQTHAGYFMVANKRIEIGSLLKLVPMGYFNQNNIGRVTGMMTTVLDDAENTAPAVLVLMMGGFINTFVFTVMVLFYEWKIGLIVVFAIFIYLFVTSAMEKKSRSLSPRRQRSQTNMVETVLEQIQGMQVIKAFNLTGKGDRAVKSAFEENKRANLALESLFTPYIIGQEIVLRIASVLMIIMAIYLYLQGEIQLLKAIMSIIMSFLIFASIQSAGSAMSVLRVATSSIDQAEKASDVPKMDIDGRDIVPKNYDISFEDVSFSYDRRQILKNLSVEIPEGKMTAIVGSSGSGKTTMCSLISRFWDVDEGSIKIGGENIRNYTLRSLMDMISTVFQRVYLFEDTIENNIKFANPSASHEEVVEAAKKAQCHDFIMSLEKGYQTLLSEGGSSLSGGEKQRISIARAILKDAPIIIFDEATANIDPENEDKLQKALEDLTKNKTVIMIAHRIKTIENADQILVLDDGKIKQKGSHDQLIRQEGIYRNFIEARKIAENWKL